MEYIEKFKVYFEIIVHFFSGLWRHNIVTVAGSEIHVGNIILAFALLFLGSRYLKNFTTRVKSYIRRKFHGDKEASHLLEKVAGYGIVLMFAVLILEISNIPISSLAFIGGALALGIGLGAQNLINNFISSIIVAIEKPIKIGDTIEVEGIIGTVASLGARCVIIITDANLEVLVPTSKLLQNSFINWSLNNNLIKKHISVKIISKDIKKSQEKDTVLSCIDCKKILEKVIDKNEYMSHSPQPTVYLLNIADNIFNYEISYWYDLAHKIPLQEVQSSLSFAFMEELSKYHIKFAISHIVDSKHTSQQSESDTSNLAEGLL